MTQKKPPDINRAATSLVPNTGSAVRTEVKHKTISVPDRNIIARFPKGCKYFLQFFRKCLFIFATVYSMDICIDHRISGTLWQHERKGRNSRFKRICCSASPCRDHPSGKRHMRSVLSFFKPETSFRKCLVNYRRPEGHRLVTARQC